MIWLLVISFALLGWAVLGLRQRADQIERDVSRLWQREHNRAPRYPTDTVGTVPITQPFMPKPVRKKAAAK